MYWVLRRRARPHAGLGPLQDGVREPFLDSQFITVESDVSGPGLPASYNV